MGHPACCKTCSADGCRRRRWWLISIWKAIMQSDPVLLYHISHLDNLPGILRSGY